MKNKALVSIATLTVGVGLLVACSYGSDVERRSATVDVDFASDVSVLISLDAAPDEVPCTRVALWVSGDWDGSMGTYDVLEPDGPFGDLETIGYLYGAAFEADDAGGCSAMFDLSVVPDEVLTGALTLNISASQGGGGEEPLGLDLRFSVDTVVTPWNVLPE